MKKPDKKHAATSSVPSLRFPNFNDAWKPHGFGELYRFIPTNSYSREALSFERGQVRNLHYGDIHSKYSACFVLRNEDVPFIDPMVASDNFPDERYCCEGDLVIADASEDYNDVGKCIEIISLDGQKVVAGLHTLLARPVAKQLAQGFPAFLMQSHKVRHQIMFRAQGTKVLGISPKELVRVTVDLPSLPEQKRIAGLLGAAQIKIQQLTRKKTLLLQYKKGVMQRIFSQQIRFKKKDGKDYPAWKRKKLNELLYETKLRNENLEHGREDVLSVSREYGVVNQIDFQGRSFAGVSLKDYRVVEPGDIVYTKSPLRRNPYGVIKANKGRAGIVSTLYAVYRCKPSVLPNYLDYYFDLDDNVNGYLRSLVHKGAKNDMKINNDRVLIDMIVVPEIQEQARIVEFLDALDERLAVAQRQLGGAVKWKKGLLQNLFVRP